MTSAAIQLPVLERSRRDSFSVPARRERGPLLAGGCQDAGVLVTARAAR